MADLLAEFTAVLVDDRGRRYGARACGGEMPDGQWQGWIEFVPLDGGKPIRSARETTQPNRTDAIYWASGLSDVYLDGALKRALTPLKIRDHAAPEPIFDEPAPVFHTPTNNTGPEDAVLNPFSVYERGAARLRQQLAAFSAWHLVNIIRAYRLSGESAEALSRLSVTSLINMIVTAVAARQSPA